MMRITGQCNPNATTFRAAPRLCEVPDTHEQQGEHPVRVAYIGPCFGLSAFWLRLGSGHDRRVK